MSKSSSARTVSFALIASVILSLICMALLSFTSISRFREITHDNQSHAECFVPTKRLTTEFEREILNARIFFIYFVTIQKPGSLEAGWKRYHQAEDRLNAMAILVDQHEELSEMRAPVAKLRADLQAYGIALTSTLQMVQSGELKGAHYDAQVKEWAARGAVMVGDAATVESLCLRLGEANTNAILASLHSGQVRTATIFLISFYMCLALAVTFIRRLRIQVNDANESGQHASGGNLGLALSGATYEGISPAIHKT